ncbi:DUF4396 domain-containing protein [Roseospira goensis]|uniref:DUF4396 domain-containing protein n=1 Tax=Roseospira goensis TaxID=391922 RepID=A0A7W6RZX1_9PROT|nr:DUF4396 domain-containing protein [Roseospira goensis]MBB4285657.1 hypothetical protein [Roseospira goensis]
MESLRTALVPILDQPAVLVGWLLLNAASLVWLLRDLRHRNPQTMGLMRWVWILTVAYSGPVGLLVYYYSGRAQIARDSLWRRAFRSLAHCYAGCGIGEIIGIVVVAGILALGALTVSTITFALAFAAGFALTMGPLMAEGVSAREAFRDSVVSETASITVMEVVAIGVDLWLAGEATMAQPLFWTSLLVSLTAGLIAAYPVNVLMIRGGIKQGMGHPAEAHGH